MSLIRRAAALAVALGLTGVSLAHAQQPTAAAVDSLRQEVHRLQSRLDSIQQRTGAQAPDTAAPADELESLRAAAAAEAQSAPQAAVPPADSTGGAPVVSGARSQNVLNPEISATGDVRLVARDQSPQTDNAVAREFELAFQSALDPYSNTKIFLTFEENDIGVEEGYIYWTGLPGRIRADVGKIRQQVGDLNRWHLHALPETEYPLVYQRFLGEEGLSGVGVSLYTVLPFSLAGGTHEVWLQGTTSESEPLYAGGRQPTLLGRVQNFWQLSPSTYAQLGFTATGGNNAAADLRTRLIGADARITWRPPEASTRREVTLRAEGYRLHAANVGVTSNRYGAFVDLAARMSRRWILGGRYDWVESPYGAEDTQWRISPTITWVESEFVYLRLEGQHRHSDLAGSENLLTLQAVWAMGPHKHETY